MATVAVLRPTGTLTPAASAARRLGIQRPASCSLSQPSPAVGISGDPRLRVVKAFDPAIPLPEALTPPSSWYTDPSFLGLEFDRVFSRGWQAVDQSVSYGSPASCECPGISLPGECAPRYPGTSSQCPVITYNLAGARVPGAWASIQYMLDILKGQPIKGGGFRISKGVFHSKMVQRSMRELGFVFGRDPPSEKNPKPPTCGRQSW